MPSGCSRPGTLAKLYKINQRTRLQSGSEILNFCKVPTLNMAFMTGFT